ncbi:DMT family transporter [Planococcus sp. CP5-4]|uniref:DMT family transporter n=1 Tax=unclassified Planococcus (in: firmicutes) TaxID=2662419 RepID=UPI001C23B5B4|nr:MULTISPECIES: EamA family transporter [unclassified Planococcus (in: firmicutes)]MBU9673303.1 DMT family transporter [Planococcus sp. CP5-4_YE]MBV0908397.1 DMT family transporter [Planococcus sp. CP5-4_UN]MBW6062611.1 DMT family transporter [Planococcus sp. CP5-4]
MKYAGITMIILAAVCWGITGGLADILLSKGWDPLVISFYRGAIGLVCFAGWFLLSKTEKRDFSLRLILWSIVAGIGVAGNFTFYFLSIESTSVPIAATLMYTAPLFVLLISFLFRLERSTWFKWGCIFSVLAGIVLLTKAYDTGSSAVNFIGVATGLGAGLSYALFIFGFKNASEKGKPQMVLTLAFIAFCAVLAWFVDFQEAASVFSSSDVGWFIAIGIVGAGLSFALYTIGIERTAPSTASIIAMVEPVTASLFGLILLGDELGIVQIIGMVIILLTVTTLSFKKGS